MDKETRIEDLNFLNNSLREKLKKHFFIVDDILRQSFLELVKIDGLSLGDVACIIMYLHESNLHLLEEEKGFITLEDYCIEDLEPLFVKCETLIKNRNNIHHLKEDNYLKKESILNHYIEEILLRIFAIKNETKIL